MVEIVFFDVETTVPVGPGKKRFHMVEFGAVVLCPRRLIEIESYSTLIRPEDLSTVAVASGRSDGITREVVSSAPKFEQVADRIFGILNGRVWGGHNMQRFDCARIREAFTDIGRPCPEPVGIIDSLAVLMHGFGRRAGNLKERSLNDVRMNLEVLKYTATVLLLGQVTDGVKDLLHGTQVKIQFNNLVRHSRS
ncbi:hypothetical protein QJS10_CPA16g01347 [Acorus calamus]|uniref:Exonuclease domain-containing protein n=1 Tax=Acorus calamus TaxID=4465 RepID=A0AAV9CYV3_ACOCL|nr:hypothetical protein QJS10_CPA16g01347 [Acorus calamus]